MDAAPPTTTEPTPDLWWRRPGTLAVAAGAWPVVTAIGAGLLFAFKVLRVTRGDPASALAVAQASDKPAVFAGLLVQLTPLLILGTWTAGCLAAGAQITALIAAATREDGAAWRRGIVLLVCAGGVLAVSAWLSLAVLAWPTAAIGAAAAALVAIVTWRRLRRAPRPDRDPPEWLTRTPLRAALALLAGVVVAGLLVLDGILTGLLSDEVWLPAHRLQTIRGPVVGYVLSRDDSELVLLRERDRAVVVVPVSQVSGDVLCDPQPLTNPRSAWDAWRHLPPAQVQSC
jgi:hypothetical protein